MVSILVFLVGFVLLVSILMFFFKPNSLSKHLLFRTSSAVRSILWKRVYNFLGFLLSKLSSLSQAEVSFFNYGLAYEEQRTPKNNNNKNIVSQTIAPPVSLGSFEGHGNPFFHSCEATLCRISEKYNLQLYMFLFSLAHRALSEGRCSGPSSFLHGSLEGLRGLEVGSGRGGALTFLYQQFKPNLLVGIDFSPFQVTASQKHFDESLSTKNNGNETDNQRNMTASTHQGTAGPHPVQFLVGSAETFVDDNILSSIFPSVEEMDDDHEDDDKKKNVKKKKKAHAVDKPLLFDFVVNVESSHCYPNFDRFLAQVAQVLNPATGLFLYADFFEPFSVQIRERMVVQQGFKIVEKVDITGSVLLSLQLDGDRKRELMKAAPNIFGLHALVARFVALEGTGIYQGFAKGTYVYLAYVLAPS